MKKQFIAASIILSMLSYEPVWGQANQAQTDINPIFQQGLELFEKGKYNLSTRYFEKYIKEANALEFAQPTASKNQAHYYVAVAAKMSQSPKAENLLLNYINQYAGSGNIYQAYYHLGDLYFEKKNYKDAIQYFEMTEKASLKENEVDDLDFKKAFSHFALKDFKKSYQGFLPMTRKQNAVHYEDAVYYGGLSAYYLEDYQKAIDLFYQLDHSKKYQTTTPYYIASIQFQQGQYDEMIAYIEPKLEDNRRLKYVNQIKKLLGNAYFEKKEYAKSEKYLAESIKALPRVAQEDYYQLGYVYYQNKAYDQAIIQLGKLTAQDNEMVQNAMFILGQSYTHTGDKANAKAAFQQASRMKYDEAITEEALFNIAKITYEQNNYTEALALLKTFVNTYPQSKFNSEAQNLLADVFYKTRSYEEAISIIEGMKNLNSSIKSSYQKMTFYRAMEYYANNQLSKADEYLDKSLMFTPEMSLEALAYYWKADIVHQRERYDESNSWLAKFNSIAAAVSTEHSSRVSAGTGFYLQGYNSYKKRDFVSAQILFSKAIDNLQKESDAVVQSTIYPDAIMRLADSYFMQKKYHEAITNYNKVLTTQGKGVDYAAYQSAMIKGLTGDVNGKLDGLERMASTYPTSTYADDALFELGNTYNNIGRGNEAIQTLKKLIATYPKSEFVPYAYNRVGLILYNQDKLNEALASYKYVIQNYPKSEASQEALIAVKDVYITQGDPDGYFNLMKQYPGVMLSTSAQDSIVYQVAENQYLKGAYAEAIKGFDSYIKTYSNGAFILPARFYRGESHYFSGNQVGALADYKYVINLVTNRFTETALTRAAVISFNQKNYQEAANYYALIKDVASTEDSRNNATLGALRAYYKAETYNKVLDYADRTLAIQGLSETVLIEATFYKGIANYHTSNLAEAKKELESVVKRINNEWAAESQYTLAHIAYRNQNMDQAEKLSFEFISDYPSYPRWMVKTYILLSDIYVHRKDYFKARVTLESVVDSYGQEDELYKEAVNKLERIKVLENEGSKIIQPSNVSGFSEFEK